jgi:hypothetical protein
MKYIFALVLVLNSLFSIAQTYRYPPRNEVNKDSSLKVFVDTLKAVIARRDAPALLKLLSPNVEIAFDGPMNNIKGFTEMYAPKYPSSQVWKNLHTVVSLGGVFDKAERNRFIFPYASEMDIKNEYCDGCGSCLTIIAPDVNVRKKADRLSASVGQLNYDVVKIIEEPVSKTMGGASDNWAYIQTFDGKITGWVRNDLTWDICDYRLHLMKKKGKWQIAVFIAGD